MNLAINFFLTIFIELPIIALFFKRKKRKQALFMALLINVISWAVAHILFFTTDINIYYVAILMAAGEAIAFHHLLAFKWGKAIIMAIIVNACSFAVTQFVPIDLDSFKSRQETINR